MGNEQRISQLASREGGRSINFPDERQPPVPLLWQEGFQRRRWALPLSLMLMGSGAHHEPYIVNGRSCALGMLARDKLKFSKALYRQRNKSQLHSRRWLFLFWNCS